MNEAEVKEHISLQFKIEREFLRQSYHEVWSILKWIFDIHEYKFSSHPSAETYNARGALPCFYLTN